jgi:Domain of unknown function (DUF4331)
MKRLLIAGLAALSLGLPACSNDPTVNPNGTDTTGQNVVFHQVDRIGKPGIKALFLAFGTHSAYNQATPGGDVAAYGPSVASFVTTTAGRSAAIGSFVSTILIPDALIANFQDASPRASYLGWETGGQIASDCTGLTGETFGGRALNDDVVNTDLGLAFGNLATSAKLTAAGTINLGPTVPPADDGNDKNGSGGTPNLTNQHVACPGSIGTPLQFPYLAAPI